MVKGSVALFAFAGARVADSLTGGWLADRWGRLRTIRLGYVCAVPALVLLALVSRLGDPRPRS